MSSENNKYFYDSLIHGDAAGIKKIYQLVYPKVVRFVLKNSGQEQDAEDVFQNALMQLSARFKLKRISFYSSFEAYLYRTCMNLWYRELNLRKRKVTNRSLSELHYEYQEDILATLEQEKWELYYEKFESLSDNCKKILELYYQNMPYSKIIELMAYASESVARQRVFKCRNKLSKLIREDKRYKSIKL